jgi:hypothetical protein
MAKTEIMRIRVDSELLERIRQLADRETRSISKQVEYLIKEALKTQGE